VILKTLSKDPADRNRQWSWADKYKKIGNLEEESQIKEEKIYKRRKEKFIILEAYGFHV